MGPFILTFFFVVFILLMQFLWKYIDDLIGKGLELNVISEFLVYTSASLVPMALPLAVLLASLMTFGNLAENLELLALKSSGISLVRIMAPVMILVFCISLGAFFFANNVMPVTNLKMKSLLYDIQQQRPELTIRPGVFDNTLEGYSIRIGDRNPKTSLLTDILIFDHTEKQGNVKVTVADSGYMHMSSDEKNLVLTLYNGRSYYEMQKQKKEKRSLKSYPHRRDYFSRQEMVIEMTGFGLNRSDEDLFRNSYHMMNISQLQHFEDSLTRDLDKLQVEFLESIERTLTAKPKHMMISREYRKANNSSGFDDKLYTPGKLTQAAESPRADSVSRNSPGAGNDSIEGEKDSIEVEKDSIVPVFVEPEKIIIPLHVDTAFNSLTKAEQRKAISMAINFARSNKSLTSSNTGTSTWKVSKLRRYQNEIHRKYTLSFLCLVFFFIGAPLGAIIRKGGLGMPVIASVLLFLIYYVISITGEKFAREGILTPFGGMWISTFILVPVSIWLTSTAVRDSVILNVETYFTWFKKTGEWLKKRFRNL